MSTEKEDIISKAFPKVVSAIRSASGLAAYDVNFYKRLDNSVLESSESSSTRLVNLINVIAASSKGQEHDISGESIESSWSQVSNLLDAFFERSDIAFDNLRTGSSSKDSKQNLTYLDDNSIASKNSQVAKRIEKPQLNFKTVIDNSEQYPFKPLLTSKPNSVVPFEETFVLTTSENENDPPHYRQPYETEILTQEYNQEILEKSEPVSSRDWQSTEPIWVDTVDELKRMVIELRKVQEIAVDLEHHDYRSYYGLVCLMQISTRDQDWLIDTLALREDLQVLNVVFTDPQVTKIFHGAFMDIIWLQRDLGLYIVSLFDTYHASRLLGFPKHSLAYLLERFANFKTSKKYQLADWRIRPLTSPMRLYARSDTHFLLNIFDQLKNMLIESNKLTPVLFESRNVARRRFEYSSFRPVGNNVHVVSPIEKSEPWKSLLYQYNLSPSREHIVKSLYEWRDKTARSDDESPRYVMPNQLLVSLAASTPIEPAGVLSSSNAISDHVRKNCKEIAELIKKCLKESEEEDFSLLKDLCEGTEKTGEVTDFQVKLAEKAFSENISKLQTQSFTEKDSKATVNFSDFSNLLSFKVSNKTNATVCSVNGKYITSTELLERAKLVEKALTYSYHPDINSAGLMAEEEMDVDVQEGETTEFMGTEQRAEPAQIFGNPEEIIVLKKKKIFKPQGKKDEAIYSNEDAIDYEKAESIMKQQKPREKNVKKRSSSTFDPYSKESEGPKPVKKQQILQLGKNTSFFNKKRK